MSGLNGKDLPEILVQVNGGVSLGRIGEKMGLRGGRLSKLLIDGGIYVSAIRINVPCKDCGETFTRRYDRPRQVRCPPCQKLRIRRLQIRSNVKKRKQRARMIKAELHRIGGLDRYHYLNFGDPWVLGTIAESDLKAVPDHNGQGRVKLKLWLESRSRSIQPKKLPRVQE